MLSEARLRQALPFIVTGMLSCLDAGAAKEGVEGGMPSAAVLKRSSDWRDALRTEFVYSPEGLMRLADRVRFIHGAQVMPGADRATRFVIHDETLNDSRIGAPFERHDSWRQGSSVAHTDSLSEELSKTLGLSPLNDAGTETDQETEVQAMPAFVIKDRTMEFCRLKQDITAYEIRAREAEQMAMINRKLGNHVYEVHTKHFGAGVLTIFYIPVFAGFGFSW